MQKMILLPYDRYQRLLTVQEQISSAPAQKDLVLQQEHVSEPVTMITNEPESKHLVSEDIEKLLPSFPKSFQSRARALLSYISPPVAWNEKGEAIIKGETISNSNIVDLVKVQFKDYKSFKPIGLEKFNHILEDMNVPLSLLSGSRRVQSGRGSILPPLDTIPPPPGSPVNRKTGVKRKANTKRKWLRL